MTPQELKNSILQLAIQGKLVEQRPEEGTAEELYKQIQAEKQALIKVGKIKKEKPLPEITEDEIPFEIPESWKWARLGSISLIEAGGTPDRNNPEYWNGDIPWVKIGDISSRDVTSASEYITQKGLDNSSAKVFPIGTLLYTIFATIGTVGILRINAATNQAIAGITLFANTDINYIYHVCVGLKYILVAKAHGMAQMNINQKILKNTPIPIPPLAEQKRIVAKIEELLPLIDRYEKAWSRLEDFNKRFPVDMQKSILQMAIQGKLVEQLPEEGTGEELFCQIQAEKQALIKAGKIKKGKPLPEIADDEIPFEIPESWVWVKLSNLLSVQPSNGFSPKGVEYQTPFKNLTLTATTSGAFKPDAFKYVDISAEVAEKYYLNNEDILIQRSNSRELVGTPCIYRHGAKGYIYPDLMMRLHLLSEIDTDYIVFVLKAPLTRSYFQRSAAGTSESMPKINQGTVRNTLIPLPPLAEQKRIVARLEELLPLCERLK